MSEEISKEDILNVTGSMFDTFLDYVDNSNNELEQLEQENNQLKDRINKALAYLGSKEMYDDDFDTESDKLSNLLKGENNE